MPEATGKPTVLVTDAGRGSAITIIRSIGRLGWRVIAADSDPGSLGFRSRYTWSRCVYPSPETDPPAYVEAMSQAVDDYGVDLIIPVTDAALLPLSAARDRFEARCRLAIASEEALRVVTDKQKTLALAEQLGVPVPRTCLVETVDEARRAVETFEWPVVLKPQTSRRFDQAGVEAFTVTYAEDMSRLVERMSQFEGRCPVLLQEYFQGEGHGVELLMRDGTPLAAFQHRRLREVPVSGGASAFRESVPLDPTLYDYAVRLLKALRWTGLAMVEFKVGKNGARLMEINGRVWGSLPLAVHSGMDFPARLARMYLCDEPAGEGGVDTRYVIGRRSRNLELDVVWIATVLRGKQRYSFAKTPPRIAGIAALLGMLNPSYRFDILSLDDPRPGLAEIPRIIRKLRRKLREAA